MSLLKVLHGPFGLCSSLGSCILCHRNAIRARGRSVAVFLLPAKWTTLPCQWTGRRCPFHKRRPLSFETTRVLLRDAGIRLYADIRLDNMGD